MSNLFSFARFGRLFTKFTVEHWKSYLMGAGVLAASLLLVMGFLTYVTHSLPGLGQQTVFLFVFLLGAGFLFTSSVFADFGEKSRAVAALTLPASQLEKYLVAWLYSGPLFLLAFVGIFFAVDSLLMTVGGRDGQVGMLLNLFAPEAGFGTLLLLFLVVHGLALWGSIFFGTAAFIKTGMVFFTGLVVVILLNYQVLKALLGPSIQNSMPFLGAGLEEQKIYYTLNLPDAQQSFVGLVLLILAGLLWLAAYARLREKQL